MKIVILEADCLGTDVSFDILHKAGTVVSYGVTKHEEIAERIEDADIVLTNRCRMEEVTVKNTKNLKLVCIMGTGTDMIDQDYMKRRGIIVSNVRGYSTFSVAQHTFALLFYVLEHMRYYDEYVKDENYVYGKSQYYMEKEFTQIAGKTFGICGLGAIGKQVAKIASAFGARVIYYSTSGRNSDSEYKRVSFEELLQESDILSIHAPLTEASRGLFTYEAFKRMKKTAILVNVGSGAIINEEDLARALNEDLIQAAALDVAIKEPFVEGNPLLAIKDSSKLVITPHVAWAAREARQLVIDEMYENMKAMIDGGARNVIWEE